MFYVCAIIWSSAIIVNHIWNISPYFTSSYISSLFLCSTQLAKLVMTSLWNINPVCLYFISRSPKAISLLLLDEHLHNFPILTDIVDNDLNETTVLHKRSIKWKRTWVMFWGNIIYVYITFWQLLAHQNRRFNVSYWHQRGMIRCP